LTAWATLRPGVLPPATLLHARARPALRLCILLAWLCILLAWAILRPGVLPSSAGLRPCAWLCILRLCALLRHVRARPAREPDLRAKPAPQQRNRQRQRAQANRDPAKPTSFIVHHIHASVYPIRCGDWHISRRPCYKDSRMVFRNYSEVIEKSCGCPNDE
jgi:hypothetical protein